MNLRALFQIRRTLAELESAASPNEATRATIPLLRRLLAQHGVKPLPVSRRLPSDLEYRLRAVEAIVHSEREHVTGFAESPLSDRPVRAAIISRWPHRRRYELIDREADLTIDAGDWDSMRERIHA